MPTHFLLASEVNRPEELEYADFLLGPQASATTAPRPVPGHAGLAAFRGAEPARRRQSADPGPEHASDIDFAQRRCRSFGKEFDRGFAAAERQAREGGTETE